jgi:uncharacterized protein YhfF/N-acetylglutamate synthase-like GNAT family acetyltransferase
MSAISEGCMSEVSTTGGSSAREPTRWGFATPGTLRDTLTALAFGGGKVVTSDLLANYEIEGEPVERPGDISILLDSDEQPVAMIEDVRSIVIRLADMADEDAVDEGEGYADAAAFRVSHEDHWNASIEEVREGIGDPTFTITDDTPIVVERFRIAAILGADGSPIEPIVRPAYPPDRPAVDGFLAEHNADVVARRGELVDARRHPALIVEADGAIDGVLTWVHDGPTMEVLTLHAANQWAGAGSALLAAARRVAEASGVRRIWLITTNDNVDALRFYQRRGYRLARVGAGAVDRSRAALKPSIPEVGAHGIPLRDELELELLLGVATPPAPTPDATTLLALELALAHRDEAAIPGGYEAVLAPDLLEIGSSGRRWTRAEILEALHAEPPNDAIAIESFDLSELAADVLLATYDAVATDLDGVATRRRRSSTWIRGGDRWQLRFHQGTPVPNDR